MKMDVLTAEAFHFLLKNHRTNLYIYLKFQEITLNFILRAPLEEL